MDACSAPRYGERASGSQEVCTMFPWLWFWAPQVHFPWSGSVAQHIAPEVDWFFGAIRPGAGNARIERQAFDVASYGKQLGLITEVLLELAQQAPKASARARASIERLEQIQGAIEHIKAAECERVAEALVEQVRTIRRQGGARAKALDVRLRPLLESPT
jgi:hypothetical protein